MITYYIYNVKTDEYFDTESEKFVKSNFAIDYCPDKYFLENLITREPEKFKNCKVAEHFHNPFL